MKKKVYRLLQVVLCAYFVIYMLAVLNNSEYWGNILSPAGTFIAFVILLFSAKSKTKRQYFLLLSLACFSWAAADVLWAIYYFIFALDPNQLDLFTYLYFLPNIFMTLTVGKIMFDQRKSMMTLQLIIDITAFSCAILAFIWIIAFNDEFKNLLSIDPSTIVIFFYMLTDFFVAAASIMWLISISKIRKRFVNLFIMCLGIISYALIDMFYSYQYFNNLYIPNNIVDGIYMTSFMLFAWGGLRDIYYPSRFFVPHLHEFNNFSRGLKGLFLLLPLFILLTLNKINMSTILVFLIVAAVYEVVSHLITAERKNEELLYQEKTINAFLEELINERTEELKKSNQDLEMLVKKDYTAKIYNKSNLVIILKKVMQQIKPSESILILIVYIERLNEMNDVLRHKTIEKVLKSTVDKFRDCISIDTVVARLSNKKFALILKGNFSRDEAEQTARIIIRHYSGLQQIDSHIIYSGLNIGMGIYPGDGLDSEEIVRKAELALSQAQKMGINQCLFFNESLQENINRKTKIRMLLDKADFEQEFQLYYQPQYDITGRVLVGAEALLRWNNPEIGKIDPQEFIPIAEETGIIIRLGEWTIRKAINQIVKWNESYDSKIKISINISLAQLTNTAFMDNLIVLLHDINAYPEWVDIEVSEWIAMNGEKKFAEVFNRISELGFSISIDNFGNDYSSLSYLKDFPINRIKISQKLVNNIAEDNSKEKIVKAIVSMAKSLGLKVIAVGVEYKEQLEVLSNIECDEIQGRFFGYPLPVTEFEKIYL